MNNELHSLSRRRFLAAAGMLAGGMWLKPRALFAEEGGVVKMMRDGAAAAEITTQSLRGGVHVIMGSGGNIGVLTGTDGALMVDAGLAGSKPKIIEALNAMGADPVVALINTHWHFDHTDGNQWLHDTAGVRITGHVNTLKRMQENHRVTAWNFTFPPAPEGALPEILLKVDRSMSINNTRIAIHVLAPSHTDGDLTVHFIEPDVFHLGDTFWNGHYPFIDYSSGGSINGMIAVTDENLAAVGTQSIIIPGHGPVANKAELQAYREMLVTVRDRVASLKQSGKTLEETIAAKPSEAFDAQWGGFVIDPPTFAALVYEGV